MSHLYLDWCNGLHGVDREKIRNLMHQTLIRTFTFASSPVAFSTSLLTLFILFRRHKTKRAKGSFPHAPSASLAQLACQLENSAYDGCACSDLYVETVYTMLNSICLSALSHPTSTPQNTHQYAPPQLIIPADWRTIITNSHRRDVLTCIIQTLSSTSFFTDAHAFTQSRNPLHAHPSFFYVLFTLSYNTCSLKMLT